MRNVIPIAIGWLCAALVIGGCSASGGSNPAPESDTVTSQELSWPPPPAPVRETSTCVCKVTGSEYTAASAMCFKQDDDLVMSGGNELPWAIYSVGQLDEENELGAIFGAYVESPMTQGDGTQLYFGVANFRTQSWEWIEQPVPETPWSPQEGRERDYRSPEGDAHVVVVLHGPGAARISSLTFLASGDFNYVTKPENLTAECTVAKQVDLNWSQVVGADGYNVYRSLNADFDGLIRLNDGPVAATTYADSIDTRGDYFFYYVTALGDNESSPSQPADVWCMGVDMPAPFDLTVTKREAECFTVGWDWGTAGDNPPSFTLFIDTVPNFTLDSETLRQFDVFGSKRQNIFNEVEPGVMHYWKLCASTGPGGLYGRMSVEMMGTSKGFWEWEEIANLGFGRGPARIVNGDGSLAVSYFTEDSVNFAIKRGEDWDIEAPMIASEEQFMDYQDLSFGGGCFLLAALAVFPGDSWSSTWMVTGTPGDWDSIRVHGDGVRSFNSEKSGYYVTTAVGETEMCILNYKLTGAELILHTKPIEGGEWTTEVLRDDFIPGSTPSNSAYYLDGNLYVLSTHNYGNDLLLGDRDGGWQWEEVRDPSAPKLAYSHDLQRFQGEWYTPGLQSIERDLHLLHGNDLPWTDVTLNKPQMDAGYYARMAVSEDGENAIVISYSNEHYNYGIYSEEWKLGPVYVPEINSYGFFGDVTWQGGVPYMIFENRETQEMVIVKGIPPESEE